MTLLEDLKAINDELDKMDGRSINTGNGNGSTSDELQKAIDGLRGQP